MSKYIDAEWLGSRVHDVPLANGAIHGCVDKLDFIEAPSIDICFCKECIHRKSSGRVGSLKIYECDITGFRMHELTDHFCSYGERLE